MSSAAKFGTSPERIAQGREIISRDAAEAMSPMKPHLEMKSILSKKSNITPTVNSVNLQSLQSSPKMGLRKSNADETPNLARSTTLLTQSPTKDSLASVKSPPPIVDYKSVLTIFFQANSPDKVAQVDQYLQKYQVS